MEERGEEQTMKENKKNRAQLRLTWLVGGWDYVRGRGLCQRRNGGRGPPKRGRHFTRELLICEQPLPDWAGLLLGRNRHDEVRKLQARQASLTGGGSVWRPPLVNFISCEA